MHPEMTVDEYLQCLKCRTAGQAALSDDFRVITDSTSHSRANNVHYITMDISMKYFQSDRHSQNVIYNLLRP